MPILRPAAQPPWITVVKSSYHQLSQIEIASDNPCARHLSEKPRFTVSPVGCDNACLQQLLPIAVVRLRHPSGSEMVDGSFLLLVRVRLTSFEQRQRPIESTSLKPLVLGNNYKTRQESPNQIEDECHTFSNQQLSGISVNQILGYVSRRQNTHYPYDPKVFLICCQRLVAIRTSNHV
jgi:hypothetical protein